MKTKRHAAILQLISDYEITTQEELLDRLRAAGYDVTQATISRDIKELRLVKSMADSGKYRYSVDSRQDNVGDASKLYSILRDSVITVECVRNFIVLKCLVGMAQAACAALDGMQWSGVVGTLAGDDTIFILMRSDESAAEMTSGLRRLLKHSYPVSEPEEE